MKFLRRWHEPLIVALLAAIVSASTILDPHPPARWVLIVWAWSAVIWALVAAGRGPA